jgi:cyclopropane fatty-acyl-phospholipid synthase-like methyltransferase
MTCEGPELLERFPRSARYSSDWLRAGVSGGANPLWLAEWLTEDLELSSGMRVLDLGCGRALSSIFLHLEFGVQVWAIDLWFSADENLQRIRDAGAGESVFPLHADARSLPFATEFFDAVVCLDAFPYFGTDDLYLGYLARFVKPGAVIGIAGAGTMREFVGNVPEHLHEWWEPGMSSLHTAAWWRKHWERTGIVDVDVADAMPNGWRAWLAWQRLIAPGNVTEIRALERDAGEWLGYVRAICRRRNDVALEEPISRIPGQYESKQILRESEA